MASALERVLLGLLAVSASAAPLEGPCDIYARGQTPCVAAHSLTRALYGAYTGALYQVQRASDNATRDIPVLAGAGIADSEVQDAFCKGDDCTVLRIYDQSPNKNHLDTAPPGGAAKMFDKGVNATANRVFVVDQASKRLRTVYGAKFEGRMGYRNDRTQNVAVGDEPETMYMVVAGRHYNNNCCFDYGNAETDNLSHKWGTMEAVYFGNQNIHKNKSKGSGSGPWVMADLETGLWAGNKLGVNPDNAPINTDFVTAMVKGDSNNHFALKHADATGDSADSQKQLTLLYDGPRPPKYEVMKKQGAIILGIGGDNSNKDVGTFYEGVMTTGFTDDAIDQEVQANILKAGYQLAAPANLQAGHILV